MAHVPEKAPARVPTRGELYNLALIYLLACAVSLIGWAGMDIANHVIFQSPEIDSRVKPALLIVFVFFFGMAISFYHKARVTLFITPPKEEKVTIKLDSDSAFTKDAYLKNNESAKPDHPPDSNLKT